MSMQWGMIPVKESCMLARTAQGKHSMDQAQHGPSTALTKQ